MVIRTLMVYRLLAIARTRTAMSQTKISNRIVLVGCTAPANEKTTYPRPSKQRPTTYRIVIIRNGELVSGGPGR